jgi:hypothetical protein
MSDGKRTYKKLQLSDLINRKYDDAGNVIAFDYSIGDQQFKDGYVTEMLCRFHVNENDRCKWSATIQLGHTPFADGQAIHVFLDTEKADLPLVMVAAKGLLLIEGEFVYQRGFMLAMVDMIEGVCEGL